MKNYKLIKLFLLFTIIIASVQTSIFAQYIYWDWKNPGEFYLYSKFFTNSSEFKGGGDVDTYGNLIYVNAGFEGIHVYEVSVPAGSDINQHPDNPKAPGPIAPRTLKYIKKYSPPDLAGSMAGELYAAQKGIYYLKKEKMQKVILYYEFATGKTTTICDGTNWIHLHLLGYDDVNDVWYGGSANGPPGIIRTVYSYTPSTKSWIKEFSYEDLKGEHFDGMEVIASKDSVRLYLSDMTSDYIGIVTKKNGIWGAISINKYKDKDTNNVEGMGYGAFHHFWATSGATLYEIGGGGLAIVEPPETVSVTIPVEQTFTIEEHSPAGTVVGKIAIHSSNTNKTNIKVINNIPEFQVSDKSPFEITIAAGVDLDFDKQNVYKLIVVAYPKSPAIGEPDTSIVIVHVIKMTAITDNNNLSELNTKIKFNISGNKLRIEGLKKIIFNLNIVNLRGQNILTIKNTKKTVINCAIPCGVYYVSIISGKKKLTEKIYVK